jgi:hypothetical protein
MAQEAPEVVRDACEGVTGVPGKTLLRRGDDLRAQLVAHALIGIQAQHPVVPRRIDRELLLRAVAGPVALDDARTQAGGEFPGRIMGVRVHDHDLVAEAQRAQACLDAIRLVERDNAGRQATLTRHACSHRTACSNTVEYNSQ